MHIRYSTNVNQKCPYFLNEWSFQHHLNNIFQHRLNNIFQHHLNNIFQHPLNNIFQHHLNNIFYHYLNNIFINLDPENLVSWPQVWPWIFSGLIAWISLDSLGCNVLAKIRTVCAKPINYIFGADRGGRRRGEEKRGYYMVVLTGASDLFFEGGDIL